MSTMIYWSARLRLTTRRCKNARAPRRASDSQSGPGQQSILRPAGAGGERPRRDRNRGGSYRPRGSRRATARAVEAAVQTVVGWLEAGERTYLHCRAGWQRSPAVAAGVVAILDSIDVETARLTASKPAGRRPGPFLTSTKTYCAGGKGKAASDTAAAGRTRAAGTPGAWRERCARAARHGAARRAQATRRGADAAGSAALALDRRLRPSSSVSSRAFTFRALVVTGSRSRGRAIAPRPPPVISEAPGRPA